MCGIAGFIGNKVLEDSTISAVKNLIKKRGPDTQNHESFYVGSTNYNFFHSRLSIIDLNSRSNQPFQKKNCTLIFNGEIYNYLEIRKDLEKQGVQFLTNSDTEVLLESYLRFGKDCVQQFEGMWSFALFDGNTNELFLSRDRFGEKPLFYMETDHGIYFASQTLFLKKLYGNQLDINFNQLNRYLINGYKSLYKQNSTYYNNVNELEPGTNWIIYPNLKYKKEKFWIPKYNPQKISRQDAINNTRELLIKSLKIRLRSDVPLAFCLSGGVDSASIASIARKEFNYDVKAFSIIDPHINYNEYDNIQETVNDLECESVKVYLKPENMLDRLKKLIEYHDAPVLTMSYLVHSILSEKINQSGIRVACMGTGADELFTGYYDHFNLHLYEMRNHPEFDKYLMDWENNIKGFVRNPFLKNPKMYFDNLHFRDHIYLNNKYFQTFIKSNFKEEFKETVYTKESILRNRMMNEMFNEVTRPILLEDDLNSMNFSIENRSPYLDSQLFNFAYTIPNEYLIQDGYNKNILRESMKGILNDNVRLDRRKKGFNAEINSIIDLKNPNDIEFMLSDSLIFNYIDREKMEKLLKRDELPNSFGKFIFNFINAKLFLELNT